MTKMKIWLLLGLVISCTNSFAQEIWGEPYPNTTQDYTYTCVAESMPVHAFWSATGGTVVSANITGNTYTASIRFSTFGDNTVFFKSGTTVLSTYEVYVINGPPVTPSPTVLSYLCGSTVVTRPDPTAGSGTYYWQTTATGTSTSDASPTKSVTIPGTVVYLRAKTSVWGTAKSIAPTVNVSPTAIINSPTSTYYNTATGQLSIEVSNGTVDKWQSRSTLPPANSWTDVPGSQGLTTINYSGLIEDTEFTALLSNGTTCSAIPVATPATIFVTQKNFEGVISGVTKLVGPTNSGSLQLNNFDGTIVEWQSSPDATNWTSIPSSSSSTYLISNLVSSTYYRVKITKKNTTSYCAPYLVSWYPVITDNIITKNYVKEEVIRVSETNTANLSNLTSSQKSSSYTYFDGLSRTVESVIKSASPTQKDIVSFSVYDALGRQQRSYLPYTNTGSNFYSNYLTEQASFYTATSKVATDTKPYSEVVFNGSPFDEIIEQGMPGTVWQPGSLHTIRSLHRSNLANEIRIWKTNGTSPGYYAANTLQVTEGTDENGNKVISFVDKRGLLIQKNVEATSLWLKTINIYDVVGRLIYTLQPEGVKAVGTGATISAAILTKYAFKYTYDTRGRLAEKLVPGAPAATYIVYDPLERPVLIQDGNLRTLNKWFFIKYDIQNRPIMTGLYKNTTQTTQAAMQILMDGLYVAGNATYPASAYYEDRGATLHSYTNISFPKINADNTPIEVQNVNYYDNYDFDNANGDDYFYISQGINQDVQEPGYLADETKQTQGLAIGRLTGGKRLVLGTTTTTWLSSYVFYDKYGRVIQSRSNNHLNPTATNSDMDLSTSVYDFEGKVLMSKTFHNAGAGKQTTVFNKYTYDQSGRALKVYQKNNSSAIQLLVQYEYNELGQLVDKKLHEISSGNFLQSVDYRYNIRGWLTSINDTKLDGTNSTMNDESTDYFGMELLYNTVETGITNVARYNGNITATKWKGVNAASGVADQRAYKYTYDKADRMLTATSLTHNDTGTSWTKEANAFNENATYDDNGNIKTLLRNQRKHLLSTALPPVASYTYETIDNLTYTYSSTVGNSLTKVEDAIAYGAGQVGFNNGSVATTEYTYNSKGSILSDLNKGISSITYNALGKPETILFSDTRKIEYVYDAAGSKLTVKNYAAGSSTPSTTDYVGGFVYDNSALSFFSSPGGRVVNNNNTLEYQYSIADHQGNTRVLFSSVTPAQDVPLATLEGDAGDRSGEYYINDAASNVKTFSFAAHSGSKVLRVNQANKVAMAKSVAVFPGDKIDMEVWEYHEGISGFGTTSTPTTTLITLIAGALTSIPGVPPSDAPLISSGVNTGVTAFGTGGNKGDSQPAAYLNYILFDLNYKVMDMGWQIAPATTFTKQKISFPTKTIKEAGYIYVWLSYDDDSNNYVYFDDFVVKHTKTNVLQYNEYYPFGLQTSRSWTRTGSKNNFLYDAAMEQNPTTGWYDLAYRNYDPILGRFMQVDPLASQAANHSTYGYADNNPISNNDPLGLWTFDDVMWQYDCAKAMWAMDGRGGESGGGDYGGGGGSSGGWGFSNTASIYGMNDMAAARFASLAAYGAHWSIGQLQGTVDYGQVIDAGNAVLGQQAYDRALLHEAQLGNPSAVQEYAQKYAISGQTELYIIGEYGNSDRLYTFNNGKPVSLTTWAWSADGKNSDTHVVNLQEAQPGGNSGDGRGYAISGSFGFALIFGISGEWGVVSDETGASRAFYTVSANFGFGLDIGLNEKEIIPTNGNRFRVEQYEGNGKNLSIGAFFTSEGRGGNVPGNQTLDPTDFGTQYKERSNSFSPLLGLPTGFGLGDVGIIYQMGNTKFFGK